MNIGIIGKGRMGQLIAQEAQRRGHTLLFLADAFDKDEALSLFDQADVIIDFSHPDNLEWVLNNLGPGTALVIGTTGYSPQQKEQILSAARLRPVFFAANYSLGVAVLKKLTERAAAMLAGWDIEIIEKHHNQKADAPSGTALALANAAGKDKPFVYGREGRPGPRGHEIGIHAVRGGTLAGEHDVLFLGPYETVTLSHNAQSRDIFVQGALKAAEYVVKQAAGLYDMDTLTEEL